MIRYAGLDISPTGTGVAVIDLHDTGERVRTASMRVDMPSLPRTATLAEREAAMQRIARVVMERLTTVDEGSSLRWWLGRASLLAVESPPYKAGWEAGAHDRSGLWWRLVASAVSLGIPVAEVNPSTLKVYATGNGRADKGPMVDSAKARIPGLERVDLSHDCADAYHLAMMAARACGDPVERIDLPDKCLAAVGKPRWPWIRDDDRKKA